MRESQIKGHHDSRIEEKKKATRRREMNNKREIKKRER